MLEIYYIERRQLENPFVPPLLESPLVFIGLLTWSECGHMTCLGQWHVMSGKLCRGKKLKYAEFMGWSQLVTINILCQILHGLHSSAMQNTTSSALSGSLLCFVTSPCFLLSQTCTATFSSAEPTRPGRIIQQRPDIVLLKWKNCQYVNLSIQQNLCTEGSNREGKDQCSASWAVATGNRGRD